MNTLIRRFEDEQNSLDLKFPLYDDIVIPGDMICTEPGYIRGHGTYEDNDLLYATVCGKVESVNKLTYTKQYIGRYSGSVGDLLIGRILEISGKRWIVDVGASQNAQLGLACINLPGSIQRRRTDEDLLDMRQYLQEEDIICTEVQRVQHDGLIQLHARNARYGKLMNGCLIRVPQILIKRQAQHIAVLKCDIQVILGMNGFIWISLPVSQSHLDTLNYSVTTSEKKFIEKDKRENIIRVRCIIQLLAQYGLQITTNRINKIFDSSLSLNLMPFDITRLDCKSSKLQYLLFANENHA